MVPLIEILEIENEIKDTILAFAPSKIKSCLNVYPKITIKGLE